jgi:hypothetical protein
VCLNASSLGCSNVSKSSLAKQDVIESVFVGKGKRLETLDLKLGYAYIDEYLDS